MHSWREQYWQSGGTGASIRRAIVLSLMLHVGIVAAMAFFAELRPRPVQPGSYAVNLVGPPTEVEGVQDALPPPSPEPPKEEPKIAPEPEPPKEEPTPEPPKEEPEPKPEPPKEEPKVAKVEEPKPVPKPEPKKEPEPLKKEPPKEAPPKKEPAKPQPTQIAKNFDAVEPSSLPQSTQTPKKIGAPKTGAAISNALPSALDGWSRLVQRKVERYWEVPGGVRVGPDGDEAVIAFWVDRQGQLIGRPEIIKEGRDPILAKSGMDALLSANPLPPFPVDFSEPEQLVTYSFSLVQ